MTKRRIIGIACSFAAAVIFGLSASMTKLVTERGVTPGTQMLVRGIIGAIFLYVLRLATRSPIKIAKVNRPKILILSIFGNGATLIALTLAYNYLPVGTVTTIHFLYPAVVIILSAVFFKEKVPLITWITVAVSTAALFLFFESITANAYTGVFLSIGSVIAWSFQLLYLDHSGIIKETKLSISFYMTLSSAVIGGIYGLLSGDLDFSPVPGALPILIPMAFLTNVAAALLYTKALEIIGAGMVGLFSVLEPLSSIFFGALLLREKLTGKQILASAIIITSIAVMIGRNVVKERKPR